MDLAQRLADVLEEAAVLDRNRGSFSIERVRQLVADIKMDAAEYLTWISEPQAIIRSSHKEPWFRQRFPEWQRQGHARVNPKTKRREYRQMIVPLAHDVDAVRANARDAAREEMSA